MLIIVIVTIVINIAEPHSPQSFLLAETPFLLLFFVSNRLQVDSAKREATHVEQSVVRFYNSFPKALN